MSFACKHFSEGSCVLLNAVCEPGMKGCTLYGKFVFSDPKTPSNKAVERKELRKNKNDK